MARADLGALWDAWRTRSDESALLQLLDEVEPELLRAARRYSRDESSAHDLVQETWQAALSKAHAYDANQPLIPWLVGFLLVESKRERRRSSRGVDPDRLHAREEPPPDHAASHDEERRMVKSAVASLPDLYREVVELTYERGLEPAQIAEQLERAPGTVRVQLHRGLAKLRAALPAGLSLGVAVMLLGGTSEAALRASLADAALSRADEIARAAPSAAATVGAWKIAAAVILAVVAGSAAWWSISKPDAHSTHELALERENGLPIEAPDALTNAGTSAVSRTAVAPIAPAGATRSTAPGTFVLGSVRGFERGTSDEKLAITLRPADVRADPFASSVTASSSFELDVSLWFTDSGPHPRQFFCVVDTPRSMPARVEVWLDAEQVAAARKASARTQRFEIPVAIDLVPAACAVSGRAPMPTGAPREGLESVAQAALFETDADGKPMPEPTEAVSASSDGSFRVRSGIAGAHLLVILRARARPVTLRIDLRAGDEHDVGTVPVDPGASLCGTARRVDGTAAADARVSAVLRDRSPADREELRSIHGHPVVWDDGRFELPAVETRADDQGLFYVDGLAPRTYLLRCDGARESSHAVLWLDDDAPAPAQQAAANVDLESKAPASGLDVVSSGLALSLRVTAGGAPLANCAVDRVVEGASTRSVTDESGLIELRARRPVETSLRVAKPGYSPAKITIHPAQLEAGASIDVALDVGPAPAHVTFDTPGVVLASASVVLAPAGELDSNRGGSLAESDLLVPGRVSSSLDTTGAMQTVVAPGRYKGLIRDNSRGQSTVAFLPTWFDIDVPAGVEYRFPLHLEVGGQLRVPPPVYAGKSKRLAVELTDAKAHVVPTSFTSAILRSDARAGSTSGQGVLVGASSLSCALAAGTYTVRVSAPDAKTFEGRVVIEAGKTVEFPVTLEPR